MSEIDHSTFVKFRGRLKKTLWFDRLFRCLVKHVIGDRKILNLILDPSFVETYSRYDEQRSGYSGYKDKEWLQNA